MKYFALAIVLFFIPMAVHASGGHHCKKGNCGGDTINNETNTSNTYVAKKTVVVPVWAIVAGAVGGYCIVKRFILNDPCIGKPKHETTPADDKVTPDNTADKPIGVKIYQ